MGSTEKNNVVSGASWDHPHIHGEHFQQDAPAIYASGSPPYTWGALVPVLRDFNLPRITPIYMGST